MTFEELQKANAAIKTTEIQKKDYAEVNQRIKAFRMLHPNGAIITEMVSNDNGVCVFRANATDESGFVLGTGTAYEKEGSTFINKTSYIENCETSAVGRALGMCGIGIDTSVASADEVANAIANQSKPAAKKATANSGKSDVDEAVLFSTRNRIEAELEARGLDKKFVCGLYKIGSIQEASKKQLDHMAKNMNELIKKQEAKNE